MNPGSHIISRISFELGFFSTEKSHELQEAVSRLAQQEISQRMHLLFSDSIAAGEVLQIDKLSLELGEIPYENLEKELPDRIIASLKEELSRIKQLPAKPLASHRTTDILSYKLGTLERYLLTGDILRREQGAKFSIETDLAELLEKHAADLVRLLKKTGRKERARKRMAYQFMEKTIIHIIRALEPSYQQVISDYVQELDSAEKPVTAPQGEMATFKKARYYFALTYLFVEKGSVFNTRNFVRSLIRQMASHYNMAYQELLLLLSRQSRGQEGIFSKSLTSCIREIFLEDFEAPDMTKPDTSAGTVTSSSQEADDDLLSEYLRFFLENGSLPIQAGDIRKEQLQARFSRWLAEKPGELKRFLQGRGSGRKIATVVRFFSESSAHQLFAVLAPSHAAWMRLWIRKLGESRYMTTHPEYKQALESRLLLSALSSLIAQPQGTFREAAFVDGMLTSLSRYAGQDAGILKAALRLDFEQQNETAYMELLDKSSSVGTKMLLQEHLPENQNNSNNDQSGLQQMQALAARRQPGQSQWILSFYGLLLRSQSYFRFTDGTHATTIQEEIRESIIHTVLSYKAEIFSRSEFLRQVLQRLARKSGADIYTYMTKARDAMQLAGGAAYSRLLDAEALKKNTRIPEPKEPETLLREADRQADMIRAIRKLQPGEASWILSLIDVISKALAGFPLIPSIPESHLQTELHAILLSAAEHMPYAAFKRSAFLDRVLYGLANFYAENEQTFFAKAKAAIAGTSGKSYSELTGSLAEEEETIKSQIVEPPLLTERQEVDILLYFLTNGSLPWWADNSNGALIGALWRKHFTVRKKKRLVSFLQQTITRKEVREHLILLLEDDLIAGDKSGNRLPNNTLSLIRHALRPEQSAAFAEAWLLYHFSVKYKKKALIWIDIQNLFAAKGESLPAFYEALLHQKDLFSETPMDGFLALLHAKLPEQILLCNTDRPSLEAPSLRKDTHELESLSDKDLKSPEEATAGLSTDSDMQPGIAAGIEAKRLLDALLHFLNTGVVMKVIGFTPRQLILEVLSRLGSMRGQAPANMLYLTLKHELLFQRFIAPLDDKDLERALRVMFPGEYAFLNPYLQDFDLLLSGKNLKRQDQEDLCLLLSSTLRFLITSSRGSVSLSGYIRFVVTNLFKSPAAYQTFTAQTKMAIHRKELRLQTFLPAILFSTMQHEKRKEEKSTRPVVDISPPVVYIENAGLILLWPFMGFYFEKLGLLSERKFISKEAAIRGACLLQYLVDGEESQREHSMPLNKILCNIPKSHPVYLPEAFTQAEKDLSQELLRTAIGRWEILKSTSIEGLRNSFLKREGKLEWQDDKVTLTVEPKSYDMLIDKIPWNISVIKLPWMKDTLYITWR